MAMANMRQLVDLMHGEITLDSALGTGTKATFSIPFNKPQFRSGTSPLIDIGSIPERLQSEMSVSGCTSDDWGSPTPPQSPLDAAGFALSHRRHRDGSQKARTPPSGSPSDQDMFTEADRKNIHVLVVEDKYVLTMIIKLHLADHKQRHKPADCSQNHKEVWLLGQRRLEW